MDVTQVDAALRCLHDPRTESGKRREADAWLSQFQRSQEAWQLADTYLRLNPSESPDNPEKMFFAASTLAMKLVHDFGELAQASIPSLQSSLVQHIARLNDMTNAARGTAGAATARPILRKLCAALADVMLQVPDSDPRAAIATLCTTFAPPMGSHALLEIMRAIPEEAVRRTIKVDAVRRRTYVSALKGVGAQALALVHQVLQSGASSGDEGVMKAAFLAFGAWISCLRLPADTVAASPMLNAALEATLKYPSLFDSACSALQDVVDTYTHPEGDKVLLVNLLPALLSLEPLYDAAAAEGATENEDACHALANLFSNAGETYLDYLFEPHPRPEPHLDSQRVNFVRVLTKITSHASLRVSSATFVFWKAASRTIYDLRRCSRRNEDRLRSFGNPEGLLAGWRQHVLTTLMLLMPALTNTVLQRLQYPPSSEWDDPTEWPADRKYNFKGKFRYDCSDTLALCCDVLGGGAVLQILATRLQSELAVWQAALQRGSGLQDGWQSVEACLYGVRAIARYVPDKEGTVLPGVFGLLTQLPLVEELKATSYRLIGRYSDWLRANGTFLWPALKMVLEQGLNLGSGAGVGVLASTPAVRSACRAVSLLSSGDSSSLPVDPQNAIVLRDEILKLVSRVPLCAMNLKNAEKVLDGLARATGSLTPPGMPYVPPTATPTADHATVMMAVATPLLARIAQFLESPAAALEGAAADGLLLGCLTDEEGEPDPEPCSDLGVPPATVEQLVRASAAQGGSIVPQLKSGVLPRAERAAAQCVWSLVSKLGMYLYECQPDATEILVTLGVQRPREDDLSGRNKYTTMKNEIAAASQRGLTGGLLAVQQAAYPLLSRVLQVYGPGGPVGGPAGERVSGRIVWEVQIMWVQGLSQCDAATLPMVQSLLGFLPTLLAPATGAPSFPYMGLATAFIRTIGREWASDGTDDVLAAFVPLISATAACVAREFNTAVASAAGQPSRGAPWASLELVIEQLFQMLTTASTCIRKGSTPLLPSVQQALGMCMMTLPVFSPHVVSVALTLLRELYQLVNPTTRAAMEGSGEMAHGIAAMVTAPASVQQIVRVLAQCLGSPAHEPVVHLPGSGASIATVLYECSRMAPQDAYVALDAATRDSSVVPAESQPTEEQRRVAFSYMFPPLSDPTSTSLVSTLERFSRGVQLLSYAGVRGRLEEEEDGRVGFYRGAGGRREGEDGESDTGDAGSEDDEGGGEQTYYG